MARLIDADALTELIATNVYPLCDAFNSRDYGMFWTGGIEKAINEMPTIDAASVVHGEWIEAEEDWRQQIEFWRCSECGHTTSTMYNFCPNCGADMRGTNNAGHNINTK